MEFDFVKIYDMEEFFYKLVSLGEIEDDSDISIGEYLSEMTLIGRELGYVNVFTGIGEGHSIFEDDYFLEFLKDELTEQEVLSLARHLDMLDDDDGRDLDSIAYVRFDLERLDNGNFG